MTKFATLVGCAIGDALGNAFETHPWNYGPLVEWDGTFKEGGTFWWGQPGQYTDDTLMSLALSRSLVSCKGFDPADVAKGYLNWYLTKETRGIGGTTHAAMVNLRQGLPWDQSGLRGEHIGGNGTAMRIAPLGIVYRNNMIDCFKFAVQDAKITHNSSEPVKGSTAVALGTALLSMGEDPIDVLRDMKELTYTSMVGSKLELALKHIENGTEVREALVEIGSGGYVPETVAAAFYCLCVNDNYKDTVIMAVKAGGDTDTTAAVAGAMAGTLYGLDGIPDEYKSQVENFETLAALDEELANIVI